MRTITQPPPSSRC